MLSKTTELLLVLTLFTNFSSTSTLVTVSADWSAWGLFLLWVLMCFDRWSDLINFFKHSGHWNLFSPVWVRRCLWSSSERVKRFPQKSHWQTNGLSPACHLKCALKWDVFPYTLPQPGMWHKCCFFFSPLFLFKDVKF